MDTVKTRMDDFFEKFPNAEKMRTGAPEFCCKRLGYDVPECPSSPLSCTECWSRPLEVSK